MDGLTKLRPIQALAASLFFKHKKLLLNLPRQQGKTELGIRLAHHLTSIPTPSTWLFVAKNTASRRKAAREKFLRLFDPSKFHINTEMVYLKKCPTSQLLMASIDKDPGSQRGGTLSGIHWSEVAFSTIDHGESIPDVWMKVFRPQLSQTDGYALLESTNNGHNGWKDLWDNHKELGFARLCVPFSRMMEMGLVSQDDYDKEKRETLPLIFAQEYECEWLSFAGRAYEEFDEKIHVEDIPGPEPWQRTNSAIDFGFFPSAMCALFGYVRDGTIHVFDEIYAMKQLIEDLGDSITARLRHWEVQNHVAVGDHEEDRIEELNLRGIICGKANKVNTLGARIQIKELLWKRKIKIHPRCKYLIKDLLTATWNPKKEGDLNYGECTYGHFDGEAALRYLVRELLASEVEEPEENPFVGQDQASARAWQMERMNQ